MAIKKFKKNQVITSEDLNKIVDAVNDVEVINDETKKLLSESKLIGDQNKKIIEEFLTRFGDKIDSLSDNFNMLELFKRVLNSGSYATKGFSEEPVQFSVFYGTAAEIIAKEPVEGQILIDVNTGSVSFVRYNEATNNLEKVPFASQNFQYSISIDEETLCWKIGDTVTDVSAVGETGPQGQQGLRGIPGQPIELIDREDIQGDPSLDIGIPISDEVYNRNLHMSKAIVWKKKIYAPYLEAGEGDGFLGKYRLVADFDYGLEILDVTGKAFGTEDASENYSDYTFYINGVNTGVRAYGPTGAKGDPGPTWYVHLFFSATDLDPQDSEVFFSNLTNYNDNKQYLVVVSGSAMSDGVPVFAQRPSIQTIRDYYDAKDSSKFNLYTISIKPNVLTPKITDVGNGFELEWEYKQEVNIQSILPVTIRHGKAFEPIRCNTKSEARTHANEHDGVYNTYIIPFEPNNDTMVPDNIDYIYTYSFDENKLVYLGRLSGPQGARGPEGPVGPAGETGPTGRRGAQYFFYMSTFTDSLFTLLKTNVYSHGGFNPEAGDIIIDSKGNLAMITSMTESQLNCAHFAKTQGPKGEQGIQGIQGIQGEKGETGEVGKNLVLDRKAIDNSVVWKYEGESDSNFRTLFLIDALKGDKGDKGEKGDQGIKGEAPTFIYNPTLEAFEYEYSDGVRKYLVNKDVLKGNKGDKGDEGAPGPQGASGPKGDTGADGKSVNIKGTQATHNDLPSSGALENDAYLIDGYLWVYVGGGSSGIAPNVGSVFNGFKNVGEIKGPKGDHITSITYLYYADSQKDARPMVTYLPLATAMASLNSTTKYLWRETTYTFDGSSPDIVTYDIATVHGVQGVGITSISGPVISGKNKTYTINLSNGTSTSFTVIDGADGDQGDPGSPGAPGAKGDTGATINSIVETFAASSSASTQPQSFGTLANAMANISNTNKYLWKKSEYKSGSTVLAYTYSIDAIKGEQGETGDTGETGPTGPSIDSIVEFYAASDSSNVAPSTFVGLSAAMADINDTKKYLWKRTEYRIDSVVVSTVDSVTAIKGNKGDPGDPGGPGGPGPTGPTGLGIASTITAYSATANTIEPLSGWGTLATAMSGFNETNKYLWKYTQHTMTDGTTRNVGKEIISVYVEGAKGDVGATFDYTDGVLTITT